LASLIILPQTGFGGKVLSPASLEKMTTPFKNNYACGLSVEAKNGRKVIQHGGGIEGFNTELDYYPGDKLTVVVLGNVNGQAPGDIAVKLAAVVHGEPVKLNAELKEITLDPKVLAPYVGTYELMPGVNMLITLNGNRLSEKLATQPSFPIFPESEALFFLKVVDAQIEFVNDGGKVTALILHQGGRDQKARRMSDKADAPPGPQHKEVQVSPRAREICRNLRDGLGHRCDHDRRGRASDDADHRTAEVRIVRRIGNRVLPQGDRSTG